MGLLRAPFFRTAPLAGRVNELLLPRSLHPLKVERYMAIEAKERFLPSWRLKTEGIIAPDERLPWGQTVAIGLQHVVAMFGATVLAPILMGFNPNLSILFSG